MPCNLLDSTGVLLIFLCFTNLPHCCHWLFSPAKLFTRKKKKVQNFHYERRASELRNPLEASPTAQISAAGELQQSFCPCFPSLPCSSSRWEMWRGRRRGGAWRRGRKSSWKEPSLELSQPRDCPWFGQPQFIPLAAQGLSLGSSPETQHQFYFILIIFWGFQVLWSSRELWL